MVAGPLLLLIGPLVVAGVVFLVRRWPRVAAGLGAIGVLLLAGMAAAVPLEGSEAAGGWFAGDTLEVYGRVFVLTEGVQETMVWLYRGLGLICLLAAVVPQGRLFVPLSLLLPAAVAATLMVQPFIFGVLLILVVMALAAMVIQAGRPGSTLAALRSLVLGTVAVCLLLVAGWMMGADQARFLTPIWQLWLLGVVMLLAGFPFHSWVRPGVTESPALAPAVVFGLVKFAILGFTLNLWQENAWLQQNAQFGVLARGLGGATVAVAALLAFQAGGFGRLLAYTLLADIGAALMMLPVGGAAGRDALLSMLLLRFVSLTLAGTGLGLLRVKMAADTWQAAGGLARRAPWGLALFLYGTMSLAGLPLTLGFAGRWGVVSVVVAQSPWLAGLLLLATTSSLFGLGQALMAALATAEGDDSVAAGDESPLTKGVAAAALVGGVVLAVFPQILLNLI